MMPVSLMSESMVVVVRRVPEPLGAELVVAVPRPATVVTVAVPVPVPVPVPAAGVEVVVVRAIAE